MRNVEFQHLENAMGYLAELAKNPSKGSPEWQKALVATSVGVGASTVGFGALIAATGPLAPFAAIGLGVGSVFFGKNRVCTMLIANATMGDLVKDGLHIDAGVQTGRPVIEQEDWDTGRVTATKPDTIPGIQNIKGDEEFGIPDMILGGLGMYRFEKDLSMVIGFYGTGGAIVFRSTDPAMRNKRFAVSWLVPETGKAGFGVTADLDGDYASLEDFYDKTAGARTVKNKDWGKHRGKTVSTIQASLIHRAYPDTENDGDLLLTVSMSGR